jgi:hypothetical protein
MYSMWVQAEKSERIEGWNGSQIPSCSRVTVNPESGTMSMNAIVEATWA